jgi:hypothetical protein
MPRMKAAIAFFLISVAYGGAWQTPVAKPQPCAEPEYRQFDFWLGDWEVRGPKGNIVGANRIERIEQGCALQENWIGSGNVTGRSINAYSRADKRWHQAWIGSSGQFLHLVGGLRGKEMVLEGTSVTTEARPTVERVTWTPLLDGKVRQFWQQSLDGGKTWTAAFDGMYARK